MPPTLSSSVLAKVAQLQREELVLDEQIRSFYDRLFPDFRDEIGRQFLRHFVVKPKGPQQWDGSPNAAEDLITTFEELTGAAEDEVTETLDDEAEDAVEDGYDSMVGWLPQLGIDERADDQGRPGLWLLAAGVLGVPGPRVSAWRQIHLSKFAQGLRSLAIGGATLPETLGFSSMIYTQLRDRVRALAANERYRAFWLGADYAAEPFEDRLQWRWITRDDELVCKEQTPPRRACAPLHKTITTLIPVQDTHPACRCIRVPERAG